MIDFIEANETYWQQEGYTHMAIKLRLVISSHVVLTRAIAKVFELVLSLR